MLAVATLAMVVGPRRLLHDSVHAVAGTVGTATAAETVLRRLAHSYHGCCCWDIAAVVGDNVMLTVATSDMIVGPTRLLFPRAPGGIGEVWATAATLAAYCAAANATVHLHIQLHL
jgi:hypothetical protein